MHNAGQDSILFTIKNALGADGTLPLSPEASELHPFDMPIIMHINTAFSALRQLNVGFADGFVIHGYDEVWSDFLGNSILLEPVKTYVYMKVKLLFDPPSSTAVLESFNKSIAELEWRLNCEAESFCD